MKTFTFKLGQGKSSQVLETRPFIIFALNKITAKQPILKEKYFQIT